VSMPVVLSGAKKLRVDTAFGSSLTTMNVRTGLVDFLADCEVLLEICLYVCLLPESSRPGPLIPLRFCSLHHFVLPVHSPSGRGRAIAQAVSRWLPVKAARVRARVWSRGIYGGQSDIGAGFLRVLRFPHQSSFHILLNNHHHLGLVQ
jgi:hypothetical protein